MIEPALVATLSAASAYLAVLAARELLELLVRLWRL